jgi:antitoxin component of RelBE/YafQ-DinJ toxin-antitoxin module
MGKYKESPKYNIVSFRVTDEEREQIETIADAAMVTVSTVLRTALTLLGAEKSVSCKFNY